jgi:hypothetical protein
MGSFPTNYSSSTSPLDASSRTRIDSGNAVDWKPRAITTGHAIPNFRSGWPHVTPNFAAFAGDHVRTIV